MTTNARQLRGALASAIAKARSMRLPDLERASISEIEPVVAVWIAADGSASVMTPEEFARDCSRAVVIRPWRRSEATLRQAIEDALLVLEADLVAA